jgi:hypothetical protein
MTIQYVPVSRVQEILPAALANCANNSALTDIVNATCDFVDRYCNVQSGGFSVQTYDELYNGTGTKQLFLKQIPILNINRISYTQVPALWIRNNDSDMGARALVQINATLSGSQFTSTGITLTYIKSATTTTNTLTWTSYPTVTALVNAINALGNNWQAGVQGGFGTWSTSDLRGTQGSFGCRITTSYLWIHWQDLPAYRVNEITGEIYSDFGFNRGVYNWRVGYQAGYATLPNDLAQAIAELAAAAYLMQTVNPNLQSQTLDKWSYTVAVNKGFDSLSLISQGTLRRYRVREAPHYSIW